MTLMHSMQTECQSSLLGAAKDLGHQPEWPALLDVLHKAMTVLPGFAFVGLGVYDPRREVVVVTTSVPPGENGAKSPRPMPPEGEEFPFERTEAQALLNRDEVYISGTLPAGAETAIGHRFAGFGLARYACLPIRADEHLIGLFYVGFGTEAGFDENTIGFLKDLADIATPAIVNARTRQRLSKGDKRRANLVELSHVINTSLRLEAVLTDARKAIRSMDGHVVSAIALVSEDQLSVEVFWNLPQRSAERKDEPNEVMPVDGSAFAGVVQGAAVYESGDLKRTRSFAHDGQLAELGVRRYTVAPMITRGKVIGGFLFGTDDPHPALTTDVWLYENIAMQLALAVDNARQFEQLQRLSNQLAEQNLYLREEIDTEHNVQGMIGRSAAIRRVLSQVVQVAKTDSTVLILGETGVGKELVARAIHAESPRDEQPLVKLNCAAIPENLVESELFGHEKGAFTSATSRRIGRFELARSGTIFLDEIGELPLAIQAKLLRVLQDGEFERVGGSQTLTTEARLIAATNRDLLAEIERGTFRSDLYYRLNVFPIYVPSLAERREDISLLVESFIGQFNRRMGKKVKALDRDSMDYLTNRDWPGNIRELQHMIERAMILCTGDRLVIEAAGDTHSSAGSAGSAGHRGARPVANDLRSIEAVEHDHICQVLAACGGTIEGPHGAAGILGLRPSTLRSRMKRLGIRRRQA